MAFENRRGGPGRGFVGWPPGCRNPGVANANARPPPAVTTGEQAGATRPRQPPARPDPCCAGRTRTSPRKGDFVACAIPNAQLRVHGIPEHGDSWDAVSSFSLSYDGYAYWDDVSELATRSMRHWTRARTLPATVDEVRGLPLL